MTYETIFHGGLLACSSLLAWNVLQLWRARRNVRLRLRELEELRQITAGGQQRLVELSRLNAAREFEVQWLNCTQGSTENGAGILKLLEQYAPVGKAFYAWIISGEGEQLTCNGNARNLGSRIMLTLAGNSQLRAGEPHPRIHHKQEFVLLPSIEPRSLPPLHVFHLHTEHQTGPRLCVSEVPRITGNKQVDLQLLSDLCHAWSFCTASTDASAQHFQQELILIRDMLELRTLTDEEHESPQIMLEEFLKRLASLTGFERASLFRQRQTPHGVQQPSAATSWQRLATGGFSIPALIFQNWNESESQLLSAISASAASVRWLTQDDLSQSTPSLQDCLVVRSEEGDFNEVLIVLSSRVHVERHPIQDQLVRWSAQFLPQTFHKALARIQAEELSRRDALTQVANRHVFDQTLENAARGCAANQTPCSLLFIDIDHFKSINDRYGHLTGDLILRSVAQTISRTVQETRINDQPLVARYGGEEFAVLLPNVSISGASRIAEKIRAAIEECRQIVEQDILRVTASLGVASSESRTYSPLEILKQADENLYEAKRSGRNRVVTDSLPEEHQNPIASNLQKEI